MLKFEIDHGNISRLEVTSSSLAELLADSACAIRAIYSALMDANEDAGEAYKKWFTQEVDKIFVSDEELERNLVDQAKSAKGKSEEVSRLIDALIEALTDEDDDDDETEHLKC